MRSNQPQPFGNCQEPGEPGDPEGDADGGGRHVLDAADFRVLARRDVMGKFLERGVEQFDRHQKQNHADQHEPLPHLGGDDERERHRDDQRKQFLAERLLGLCCGDQPAPGIHRGAPHAKQGQSPVSETGAEARARPYPSKDSRPYWNDVRIPTPPPLVLIEPVCFASLPSKANTCSSFSWVACTTMVLPSLPHTEPCAQVPIFVVVTSVSLVPSTLKIRIRPWSL